MADLADVADSATWKAAIEERGKSRKFLSEDEAREILNGGTLAQRREAIRRVLDGG